MGKYRSADVTSSQTTTSELPGIKSCRNTSIPVLQNGYICMTGFEMEEEHQKSHVGSSTGDSRLSGGGTRKAANQIVKRRRK